MQIYTYLFVNSELVSLEHIKFSENNEIYNTKLGDFLTSEQLLSQKILTFLKLSVFA